MLNLFEAWLPPANVCSLSLVDHDVLDGRRLMADLDAWQRRLPPDPSAPRRSVGAPALRRRDALIANLVRLFNQVQREPEGGNLDEDETYSDDCCSFIRACCRPAKIPLPQTDRHLTELIERVVADNSALADAINGRSHDA